MATTITKTETLVGKRIRRREDPRLITGTATYLDDIKMPGHAPRRASCAARTRAAKIKGIDTKAALDAARRGRRFHRRGRSESRARCRARRRCPDCACRTIICWRRTASTSSAIPIAVVVATDRYIARDAADLVEVDYERAAGGRRSREGDRAGRAAGASGVARQRRVHLPPGRRRHRAGVPRRRSRSSSSGSPASG